MIPTFYNEEVVKVGDDTLRLVLDFQALDAIERETKRPFDGILQELTSGAETAASALSSRVLWGLLRRHHPDLDIGQATWLVNSASAPALGIAMGGLFESAFPRADPPKPGKVKPAHPRKPRGASKATSYPGAVSA